ncbi:NTP transf domain-containing protein [Salix suchowensis]|nr:NTP transf domain-containing protein [Salix suchowensis]
MCIFGKLHNFSIITFLHSHLSHNLDMGILHRSLSPPSFSTSSSSSSLGPHPLQIDSELWLMVEKRTQEILYTIQPAFGSEQKRKEVINYIQSLIKGYFAVEVFPFGSVPLKTYLPDGDIDLMTLSHQSMEEDLARDVFTLLQWEEQDPGFQVNDVQYIQAQVKVVKCSVKNIAVDISFNQMGGPSTLCFLEQVDQLIGRDHLFKRSVILIKAWCFYESRILGAHHGLISAYALQILVLNIINNFHSSLSGPLAVLYKFLDYYSTFDWDNYCVSINGPIPISSFPQMESVDNNGNELLLSQEFLRNCRDMFSFLMKEPENDAPEFPIKHLNVVDPLKSSNNLGRSVNKGNFHRIRGALSYGAQRLAEIIALPGEAMGARLEKFFMNTLDRNGKGQRPDADVPVPAFGTGRSEASDLSGDYDKYYSGLLHGQRYHNYPLPVPPQPSLPSSPSQIKQKSARDVLPQLLQSKQNIFSRRGTDVFLPRPKCHPYASQPQGAASGIDITRKSRGTGTYIPDVCHNRYKDLLLWMIDNPDSTHRPLSMIDQAEESPKTEKSEDGNCLNITPDQISPETEKSEDGSCLDLSLDQFPLLPSSKKSMSSEIHQSYQNIAEACQAKDCSSTLGNIQFGSFQSSPSLQGLPSSAVKKQAGSGVSITINNIDFPPL